MLQGKIKLRGQPVANYLRAWRDWWASGRILGCFRCAENDRDRRYR